MRVIPQAMAMFGERPRGGNRGGKDRFNWDDVKNDVHRENYLGASLHGQIGRWTTTARGSDLTWWSEGAFEAAGRVPDAPGVCSTPCPRFVVLTGRPLCAGRSQLNRVDKAKADEAMKKELQMVKAAEEDEMRKAMCAHFSFVLSVLPLAHLRNVPRARALFSDWNCRTGA